jgi:outer membrane protein OmpA-like peptidoglycan-associated protein
VGAAFVNFDGSTSSIAIDDDDVQFAYQGIAGIGYNVNQRLQLFVDYRYFGTTDLALRTTADVGVDADFRNHTVLAGLRYTFTPPPPPPPPEPEVVEAPPPPPPPPPEPQMPMNYLVFFDWDRYDLTEEGMRVVAAAAQNALSGGISTIMATGHADLSGPDAYNMGLSERRAETVRDQLILLGVPAEMISIAWKGEREPLVPTADGVREPQNRRVEIVFE